MGRQRAAPAMGAEASLGLVLCRREGRVERADLAALEALAELARARVHHLNPTCGERFLRSFSSATRLFVCPTGTCCSYTLGVGVCVARLRWRRKFPPQTLPDG